MKSENIMVHFSKRVLIPDLSIMTKVVHNSIQYQLQELLKPNSLHALKVLIDNEDINDKIKSYKESIEKIRLEAEISIKNNDFHSEFYQFILDSYVKSQKVIFAHGEYHTIECGDEIGSGVSDYKLNDNYFKDVRNVDYYTPKKYKDSYWSNYTSIINHAESNSNDFKFLLMDSKKIKEFWDRYPDGMMYFKEFESTVLLKSKLR